jgi:short-subunit dehydrogenase
MEYQLSNLSGSVVIITGATSGIGRSTAVALVDQGAKLVLNARNLKHLEALAFQLGESNVEIVAGDCGDPVLCRRISEVALTRFGKIDAVIANAGIGKFGSILDHTDIEISQMIQTNLIGTIHCIKAALPTMVKANSGDIIIVSSVAGFRGGGNESVYAATKHGQIGFAGSLDRELRSKGIRVSAVCPASTATDFALNAGRDPNDENMKNYLRPEDVAYQILQVLQQPRNLRTQIWSIWPMNQQS